MSKAGGVTYIVSFKQKTFLVCFAVCPPKPKIEEENKNDVQ